MPLPTPRLLLLALAAAPVIGLTGNHDLAVVLAATWLLSAAALAFIDSRSLPGREQLEWDRVRDDKLSIGQWNDVELRVWNRARQNLVFRLRDATPPEIRPRGNAGSGSCGGGEQWAYRYAVFPVHRGRYFLGPLSLRARGPLGLAWRSYTFLDEDPIRVYPDLLAIRHYEPLLHRAQLEEIGSRATRRRGSGTDFESLRDYTPDDEFRRINWPATARRHTPIATDYQTERNQTMFILLDSGRLMATRLPAPASPDEDFALTRLDYSVNAALLLAYAAQFHDDRTGLAAFADRVQRFVPANRGRAHFVRITDALYDLEASAVETDFATSLSYVEYHARRRSLLVLFTDIVEQSDTDRLVAELSRLARRHLPLLVTLRDPALDRLAALDPAGSEEVYTRAVAMELTEGRERVLASLRRRGVMTLDVGAHALSPAVVNRYLEIKARARL